MMNNHFKNQHIITTKDTDIIERVSILNHPPYEREQVIE